MAWFWTDDLARSLLARGLVRSDAVQDWLSRPVAIAGPDDVDAADFGRELLGLGDVSGVA